MEIKELTCIGCPMGCTLHVELEKDKVLLVSGNSCPKGDLYARKEVVHPMRIVTTVLPVDGSRLEKMISVKTSREIPKEKVLACVRSLKGIRVQAPIRIGDVIVRNILDTGADIVATKNA